MKINFVITKLLRFGGVEVQLLHTIRGLVERGHTIRLIVLQHGESPFYDKLPKEVSLCFAFRSEPSSPGQRIAYCLETKIFRRRLQHLITENKPDLVISYKEGPGSVLLLPGIGVPTLVYVHNIVSETQPHSMRSRFVEHRYRKALRSVDRFAFVSESSRQAFAKRYGVPPEKHAVVYNCVSVPEIRALAKAFPAPAKTPGVVRLCFVGRLEPEKGILCLLRALAELKREGFRFELLVLGAGSEEAACRKLIADNDMEQQVRMLGYCENPHPYVAASDWLVSTSEFESFGLSVLEAITLETKVFSTRSAGTEEIIEAVGGGVLAANNSQAIHDGLRDALAGRFACPPPHDVDRTFGEDAFFANLSGVLKRLARSA